MSRVEQGDQEPYYPATYPDPIVFGTDEHHGDVSPPPAQLPKPEASLAGPATPMPTNPA